MKAQIRGSKYTNKLGVRESFPEEVIPQQSLERIKKRCQIRKAFQAHYERCEAAGYVWETGRLAYSYCLI